MKFRLLLFLFIIFTHKGFSQLSEQATINYIDDKTSECLDLRYTYYNPSFKRITKLEFGLSKADKNMVIFNITYTYDNTGNKEEMQYEFNPAHIRGFSFLKNSLDAVEFIQVQMTSKTILIRANKSGTFTETNDNYFNLPYLKIDPLNEERMRKAFLLLKKHYVAKKGSDPFAN